MSAPFLRFGALFKDNAFSNDTLKLKSYASLAARRVPPAARAIETSEALRINFFYLKILNDRKRVGTSGTLVPLVPPAGNRTTASVCDRDEWVTRSHALAIKARVCDRTVVPQRGRFSE